MFLLANLRKEYQKAKRQEAFFVYRKTTNESLANFSREVGRLLTAYCISSSTIRAPTTMTATNRTKASTTPLSSTAWSDSSKPVGWPTASRTAANAPSLTTTPWRLSSRRYAATSISSSLSSTTDYGLCPSTARCSSFTKGLRSPFPRTASGLTAGRDAKLCTPWGSFHAHGSMVPCAWNELNSVPESKEGSPHGADTATSSGGRDLRR